MCLALFLAADTPVPLIAWNKESPAFNVTTLAEYEEPVRAKFSRPYVHYVGSHTQCGCGFSTTEDGDDAARRRSLEALAICVASVCGAGVVELFVCWDGDYADSPARRIQMQPAHLAHDGWFSALTFVEVRADFS